MNHHDRQRSASWASTVRGLNALAINARILVRRSGSMLTDTLEAPAELVTELLGRTAASD